MLNQKTEVRAPVDSTGRRLYANKAGQYNMAGKKSPVPSSLHSYTHWVSGFNFILFLALPSSQRVPEKCPGM